MAKNNRIVHLNGKKLTLAQAIKNSKTKVRPSTIRQRFYVYGWNIEKSLGIGA